MGFLVALNTNSKGFLDVLSTHSMEKFVGLITTTWIPVQALKHTHKSMLWVLSTSRKPMLLIFKATRKPLH